MAHFLRSWQIFFDYEHFAVQVLSEFVICPGAEVKLKAPAGSALRRSGAEIGARGFVMLD